MKQILICPVCEEGKLIEVNKKTLLEFSNPGKIVVESKVSECNKCGEILLNENQSAIFAKKADKLLKHKSESKRISVKEGDILLL
jgi:uncharacterized protein with PIN domain